MDTEERRKIAKRFFYSYIAGQNDTDAINAIAELMAIKHQGDLSEIVHSLALYPVAGEAEMAEQPQTQGEMLREIREETGEEELTLAEIVGRGLDDDPGYYIL